MEELVQELQRELSGRGVSLTNDEVRKALQEGNYLVRQFEFYQVRGQVETPAPRMQVKEFLLNHFRPPREIDPSQIEDEREASGARVPFAVRPYAEALERGTVPPRTAEATASLGLGGLPAEPGAAAPRTAPPPLPHEIAAPRASLEERVGEGAPPAVDHYARRLELRRLYTDTLRRIGPESYISGDVIDLVLQYLSSLEEQFPNLHLYGKDDHPPGARKQACGSFAATTVKNKLDPIPVFELLEKIVVWHQEFEKRKVTLPDQYGPEARDYESLERELPHLTDGLSENLLYSKSGDKEGIYSNGDIVKQFFESALLKCREYCSPELKEQRERDSSDLLDALNDYIYIISPEAHAYIQKLKQEIVPPAPAEAPAATSVSEPAAPRTTPPPLPSRAVSPRKGVRAATPSNDLPEVHGELERAPPAPQPGLDTTITSGTVVEHETQAAAYASEKKKLSDSLQRHLLNILEEPMDISGACSDFDRYLFQLEGEYQELSLPGRRDAQVRQEFIQNFFRNTVELHGKNRWGIPGSYLDSLDKLVAQAGAELVNPLAEDLASLYTFLPEPEIKMFINEGLRRIKIYRNLPTTQQTSERWQEIKGYFSTAKGTEGGEILEKLKLEYFRQLVLEKKDFKERLDVELGKPVPSPWLKDTFLGIMVAVATLGAAVAGFGLWQVDKANQAYSRLQQETKVLRESSNGTAWQAREQEWEKKYAAVERRKNEAERIEREYNPLVEKHNALQNELADLKKKGGRPVEVPDMLLGWGERIRKHADNPEKLRELGTEFNRMLSGSGVRLPTGGCEGYLRSLYRLMGGPDDKQIRQKFVDSSRGECTDQMNGHYIRF